VAVVLHVGAVVVAETRHVDAHRLSIIREVLDILWTKNTQCTVILWDEITVNGIRMSVFE
jgi:hypothetical protein